MKAFVFVQRSFGFAIRKETETGDYKSPVTKNPLRPTKDIPLFLMLTIANTS